MSLLVNNKQKYAQKFVLLLFCLFLPLFLMLFSYKITLFFVQLTPQQQQTIAFLQEKEELKLNYTAEEKSHLQDVQKVMKNIDLLFYFLLLMLTLIFTYTRKDRQQLRKLFLSGGVAAVILLLLLLVVIFVNFNYSFTIFHNIFFPQGNWLFSADSLLIKTFPPEFFVKISAFIFLLAGGCGIVFVLIGLLLKRDAIGRFIYII